MVGNFIEKNRLYIIAALITSILIGLFFIFQDQLLAKDEQVEVDQVTVEVAGAVEKPGVYNFSSQDRVVDALKKAGGIIKKKADQALVGKEINQASKLQDEQKIFIPFKVVRGEGEGTQVAGSQTSQVNNSSQGSTSGSSSTSSSPVNVNQAGLSELETLPGIGPAYAQRIIDYRTSQGGFNRSEDLLNISGIGTKTLAKISGLISF